MSVHLAHVKYKDNQLSLDGMVRPMTLVLLLFVCVKNADRNKAEIPGVPFLSSTAALQPEFQPFRPGSARKQHDQSIVRKAWFNLTPALVSVQ